MLTSILKWSGIFAAVATFFVFLKFIAAKIGEFTLWVVSQGNIAISICIVCVAALCGTIFGVYRSMAEQGYF